MSDLPPCGIYRTTSGLTGKEEWVRENLLVYFHNHSQQGPPLLLLPASNVANRWVFHDKGYLVRDEGFPGTLEPLRPEGYYILNDDIFLSPSEMIAANSLVQLGYNRAAEPIIFVAEHSEGNIAFPDSGLKCTPDIFDMLRSVGFRTPQFEDEH